MGLPIWNYTDESKVNIKVKDTAKNDGTAALRSNIRRRASSHGRRRNHANTRADSTLDALRRADGSNSTLSSADLDRLRSPRIPMSNDALARLQLPPPVPEPMSSIRQSMIDRPSTSDREGPQFVPRDYHDSQAPHRVEPASRTRLQVHQPSASGPARRPTIHPTRPASAAAATARRAARRRDFSNAPTHARSTERERPLSRDNTIPRTNLPTPPLDSDLSFILPSPAEILERNNFTSVLPSPAEILQRNNYVASPNPHSLAEPHISLDNGLGDRMRSVSPGMDVWQVMRNTITPDETLPSTSSSFTSAAAANASFSLMSHPEDPDPSFEDTMLEMGINVSSTSPASSEDSLSEPEQENDSDTSDDDTEHSSDDDSEIDLTQQDRSLERIRVAMRLYDLAMRSSQGREQIQSQRRRIRGQLNTRAPHTQLPTSLPPPFLSHSPDNQAGTSNLPPLPEPYQFGTEVHERASDATSRVHAYFDPDHENDRQAEDTGEVYVGHTSRMLAGLNNHISRASATIPRAMDQMSEDIRAITERDLSSGEMREAIRDIATRAVSTARAFQTALGERAEDHASNSNRGHAHVSQRAEPRQVERLPADDRT